MAVSSKFFNLVSIMTTKMGKLQSYIKDELKDENMLNGYNEMFNKWGVFRESLNRHDDASAMPILKDFNNQFNAYYNAVYKSDAVKTSLPTDGRGKATSNAVTISIILGGTVAAITLFKMIKK